MIVSYDNLDKDYGDLIITINTSRASQSNVCMKFSRNGKTDLMMSEPFKLKVIISLLKKIIFRLFGTTKKIRGKEIIIWYLNLNQN